MSALNPDPSRGIVDLMNKEWAVEDFQNCAFSVQNLSAANQKIHQVGYEKIISLPSKSSWLGGGLSVVKDWSKGMVANVKHMTFGNADPSSIYNVTLAFDQMAEKELSDQENAQLDATLDPEEKISIIKQFKERLVHLKVNLEHHNSVIKSYNKRFLTQGKIQGLGCAPHSKALLNHVEGQRQKWEKLQAQVETAQTAQKVAHLEIQLDQLELNIQNGVEINRVWLVQSYPLFLKNIAKLPPTQASALLERYHGITNQAYLKNLSNKIEQKSMELPYSLVSVLKNMGYKEEWIAAKMAEGANELLISIKSLLEQPDLTKDSTPAIANLIKDRMLNIVIGQMNLSNDQAVRFAALFNKLYLFEIKHEIEHQTYLTAAKEVIGQTLVEVLDRLPEEQRAQFLMQKEQAEAQLRLFNPPSVAAIDELLKSSVKENLVSESEFLQLMQNLDERIKKLEQKDKSDTQNALLLQLLDHLALNSSNATWTTRNAQFCQFKFNQGQWGGQYMLGEGVCRAVNYRWIKALLKNPSQIVSSQDQFDPQKPRSGNQYFSNFLEKIHERQIKDHPIIESRQAAAKIRERKLSKDSKEFEEGVVTTPRRDIEEQSHVHVTAQDRKLQAEYSIALSMRAISTNLVVTESVLKRDSLQSNILVDKAESSMENLIDHIVGMNINQNMQLLDRSAGVLDITAIGDSGGHALGIQIDPLSGIYRFWDVNSGFYNYPSLEELKTEANAYMQEFYKGEYTEFYATQYVQKNPKI